MVPTSFDLEARHPFKVRIGFQGDSIRSRLATDPNAAEYFGSDDATQIDDKKFMESVVSGVTKSGVFREVVTDGSSDFLLEVNIISEIKPSPGLQMKSTVVTGWRLTRTKDETVVFDELIETQGTATPGSVVGIRTAKEGAVRENVRRGVLKLSKAQL